MNSDLAGQMLDLLSPETRRRVLADVEAVAIREDPTTTRDDLPTARRALDGEAFVLAAVRNRLRRAFGLRAVSRKHLAGLRPEKAAAETYIAYHDRQASETSAALAVGGHSCMSGPSWGPDAPCAACDLIRAMRSELDVTPLPCSSCGALTAPDERRCEECDADPSAPEIECGECDVEGAVYVYGRNYFFDERRSCPICDGTKRIEAPFLAERQAAQGGRVA